MADTGDYLTKYKKFFDDFAATVNPDDQLPVKVAGYYLCDAEIVGEIVDWTLQYLSQKNCPSSLVAPLTRIVIDEIKTACRKQPVACGYKTLDNAYQPLKLMQVVTGKVNEVCLRYRDNGHITTLPPPIPGPPISTCAIKNTRRRMEDRHVIIQDFHAVFDIKDQSPTSYYAVFDGHAGTDAAIYSVSHLHQFLAESSYYPTDPEKALREAFFRTDALFLEKSNRENLRSGTTAVCALLRPKEKMLYVAWLGDSQALLVREGHAVQVVNPHKPDRQDERERIEEMGGCVLYWGTWRVNGQLAVSRAIGDLDYKPYVTAEPDIKAVRLTGSEDFLVIACDGLWDFVTEQQAVAAVYQQVREKPDDLEAVSQRLVQLSKSQGSTDNISVIVVFLTEPAQLASRPVPMESGDAGPKSGLLLDLGATPDLFFLGRTNGKGLDDLGPETDVDAADDLPSSPNNNGTEAVRRDTPTPPADQVAGVAGLVPDNVAESGEDSEDEWNYYRVEPTAGNTINPASEADTSQQAFQAVCQKPASLLADDDEDNMESQLNPNAAEFVPSPTQTMPSMEEFLLAQSPIKGVSMENIVVPTSAEFQDEVCLRPADLDVNNSFSASKSPDLFNGQGNDEAPDLLNGHRSEGVLNDLQETASEIAAGKDKVENLGTDSESSDIVDNRKSEPFGLLLDESEVSSTKAEFGDESLTGSEFERIQKSVGLSGNTVSVLDSSFAEELSGSTASAALTEGADIIEHEVNRELETFPLDTSAREILKEPIHISFELQKEIAPEMESQPERVQVDSDDIGMAFEIQETIMEASTDDALLMDTSPESPSVHQVCPSTAEPLSLDIQSSSPVPQSPLDISHKENIEVSSLAAFETTLKEALPSVPDVYSLPVTPPQLVDVVPIQERLTPELENQVFSETHSPLSDLSPQIPVAQFISTEIPLEGSKSPLQEAEETLTSPLDPELALELNSIPDALRMCVYPKSMLRIHNVERDNQAQEENEDIVKSPVLGKFDESEVMDKTSEASGPEGQSDNLLATNEISTTNQIQIELKDTIEEYLDIGNVEVPPPLQVEDERENILIESALLSESRSPKPELEPLRDEHLNVTQTPPPTPAIALEANELDLLEFIQKPQNLSDAVEKLIEVEEPTKPESEEGQVVTTAAAVAATVATAVAAGTAIVDQTSGSEKADTIKKTTIKDKKAVPDKTRPTSKPISGKPPVSKTLKSSPTSPTKQVLSAATSTPKSSPPKRTPISVTPIPSSKTKVSPSLPATTQNRAKPSTGTGAVSPTKPSGPLARPKVTAAPPKQRPLTATAVSTTTVKMTVTDKKAPVTNGEASKAVPKRPEPLASKRMGPSSTTAKTQRPVSAPIAKTSTVKQTSTSSKTTTVSSVTSRTKVTAVNGTATKPRVSAVSTTVSRTKTSASQPKPASDKQIKDYTANKHISSHSTLKSSQTTGRSTTVPSTLKIETSRTATNGKVSATRTVSTVRSTVGKTGARKTTTTTTITTTSSASPAKGKPIPSNEKNGIAMEQELQTAGMALNEVKSDIVQHAE